MQQNRQIMQRYSPRNRKYFELESLSNEFRQHVVSIRNNYTVLPSYMALTQSPSVAIFATYLLIGCNRRILVGEGDYDNETWYVRLWQRHSRWCITAYGVYLVYAHFWVVWET